MPVKNKDQVYGIDKGFVKMLIDDYSDNKKLQETMRNNASKLAHILVGNQDNLATPEEIRSVEKEIKLKYRIYQLEKENNAKDKKIETLEKGNNELAGIVENMPSPAINLLIERGEKDGEGKELDVHYYIENCNQNFADIFGDKKKETIQGKYIDDLEDIFGRGFIKKRYLDNLVVSGDNEKVTKKNAKKCMIGDELRYFDITLFKIAGSNIGITLNDVTEETLNRKQLKSTLKTFESMMKNMPVHIFIKDFPKDEKGNYIARKGKYKAVSDLMNKQFGFTGEQTMVGSSPEEIFKNNSQLSDKVNKEDAEILKGTLTMSMSEEKFNLFDQKGELKERWLQTIKIPTYDHEGKVTGIMGASFDITYRKTTEEQLQRKIEEYEAVVVALQEVNLSLELANMNLDVLDKYSKDTIYIKDAEGRFEWINNTQLLLLQSQVTKYNKSHPHDQRLVPKDKIDCIGKSDFDFFSKEHATYAQEVEKQILNTNEPKVTIEEFIEESGTIRYLQSTKSRITLRVDKEGKPVYGIVGTSTDITQLMIAQKEIIEKENELVVKNNYLQDQTEELNQNLSRLNATNEELKSSNEELNATNETLLITQHQLKLAKEEADQANELKSRFLANMSHEIRTPMNGIIGFSSLLLAYENDEKKIEMYAQKIHESGLRLLELINGILDLSKLEAKMMKLDMENFNLQILLSNLETLGTTVDTEKVTFTIEFDCDGNFYGDSTRIVQVLNNLVSNAIKYTKKGYIKVVVKKTADGKNLEMIVEDSGIGVPKEKQDKMFTTFVRGDNVKTASGTGLGMPIVKQSIDLMGGTITFTSEEGKGTSFFVTVPEGQEEVAVDSKKPEFKQNTPPIMEGKISENKKTEILSSSPKEITNEDILLAQGNKSILVIEKDDVQFNILKSRLSANGISKITREKDLNEAMKLLMDDFDSIGLVLLTDSVLKGLTLARITKEIKDYELPVVLNSSLIDEEKSVSAEVDYKIKDLSSDSEMKTFLLKYLGKGNSMIEKKYPELFKYT